MEVISKDKLSYSHILWSFLLFCINLFSFPYLYVMAFNVVMATGYIFKNGGRGLIITQRIRTIMFFSLLLLIYTFLPTLSTFDTYTIGKPIRLLLILCIFYVLSNKLAHYNAREIEIALVLSFSLEVLTVYLQFVFPELKQIFYSILETEKELKELELRAFGLVTSYDTAGMYICAFMSFLWLKFWENKNTKYLLPLLLVFLSCFMVSRTTMVYGSVLMFIAIMSIRNRNSKVFWLMVIPLIAICAIYIPDYVDRYLSNVQTEYSYSADSGDNLYKMYFLPGSIIEQIFGTGESVNNSDVGYVKIIYMIGFVGLILVLLMYLYCIKTTKYIKNKYPFWRKYLVAIVVILFLFNFKLLLLYARGLSDVFFLLLFTFLIKSRYKYLKNAITITNRI